MTNQTQSIWTTKTIVACALLVLVGVALRAQLMQQGILQDEAVTVLLSLQKNIHDLIQFGKQCDYNPPVMTLALHYLFALTGPSAFLAKLPSLVLWAILVPSVYVLGTICYNRKVGLLAAGCATFSPQAIFYACMARPYSLAAFLACLLLIFFILSLKDANHRRRWLICTAVTSLMFLYSHYTAPIYMAFLSLCAGIMWLRKKLPLIPYIVTFAIPTVLYLPWLPIMLEHSRAGCPWYAGTPLAMFPYVLVSNLSTFLPLPVYCRIAFSTAIAMVVVIAVLAAKSAFSAKFRQAAGQRIAALGAPYLVLALCSILPCMLMGYITPFSVGLYRYTYPFEPAGWALLSTMLLIAYEFALQESQQSLLKKRVVQGVAITLLLLVPALCVVESWLISRNSLSGFRELVLDIKKDELDDTLLIVAPDQDARTFQFDYHYESSPSPSVQARSFYRWEIDPFNRDADSSGWLDPQLVSHYMKRIADSAAKCKFLAVTNPNYAPDSPAMPARQRIEELLEAVGKQYRLMRKKYYQAGQESFHLYVYDLHSKE